MPPRCGSPRERLQLRPCPADLGLHPLIGRRLGVQRPRFLLGLVGRHLGRLDLSARRCGVVVIGAGGGFEGPGHLSRRLGGDLGLARCLPHGRRVEVQAAACIGRQRKRAGDRPLHLVHIGFELAPDIATRIGCGRAELSKAVSTVVEIDRHEGRKCACLGHCWRPHCRGGIQIGLSFCHPGDRRFYVAAIIAKSDSRRKVYVAEGFTCAACRQKWPLRCRPLREASRRQ